MIRLEIICQIMVGQDEIDVGPRARFDVVGRNVWERVTMLICFRPLIVVSGKTGTYDGVRYSHSALPGKGPRARPDCW